MTVIASIHLLLRSFTLCSVRCFPLDQPDTAMEFTPKWIAWEITRRCNLNCVHCRSSSQLDAVGHPDFSLDEAKRVLDEIHSYASPVMVLSGGEPLLRPDVFDIAAYGTGLGLRMCLATNGTLVTSEICRKIKESGIRMVSLSLDGSTAAVHDDFRSQPGAFDGVMNAIRLFNEHQIEFLINSSFTQRNKEEAPKIYQLVKSLGATAWYLFMIVPTGRGEDIMGELIPADEYEDMLNWHYDMEKEEDTLLVRPTCAPQYYRIVLRNFSGYKDNCGRCEYINVCGGCRARSYAITGDYLAGEPFCNHHPGR